MNKLTVLMPSLNEEKSIGRSILMIPREELAEMGYELEVLIIDGGSKDGTREIAEGLGARVIMSKSGYGTQYRIGFDNAQGDIIVTADSDCSYPMEDIPRLLEVFNRNDLEFLTANRFAKLESDAMRTINKIGNRLLTWMTNRLYRLGLQDSQSGMWIIKKRSLEKIRLASSGMSLSEEIKIEAFKKLRSMEVDSGYRKRVGRIKLRMFVDGWKNIYFLLVHRI